MTTELNLGYSLKVVSLKPKGVYFDGIDSPMIGYTVAVSQGDREIWCGPYYLGTGYIQITPPEPCDWPNLYEREFARMWAASKNRYRTFRDRDLWAKVAARYALIQEVTPELHDVMCSLLSDGAAYFDAYSFEDWASELGYDGDSRKAERTYNTCRDIGRALVAGLGWREVNRLRRLFADY